MNKEYKLPRDLKAVEKRLQAALQPVKPPALFVQDLRSRLDQEMAQKQKTRKVRAGLLIAGGIVGLAALLITVIRSMTSWDKTADSVSRFFARPRKREGTASI